MSPFPTNWNSFLSAPLVSSAALRRELRRKLPETAARHRAEAMLKGCTPKTTPLYLRMIQACAQWLLAHPNADHDEATALTIAVAQAVKRFDLTLD